MPITFIDSGVLIAASRGNAEVSGPAMLVLDDPGRSFAASEFVRLEVLPKAVFNKKSGEAEFYSEYFQAVTHWPSDTTTLVNRAYEVAAKFGLAAMDALHIAAALMVGAEEFITTEKPDKPLHRVTDIRVRSIHTDSSP